MDDASILALKNDTKPFAREFRAWSWWSLLSTVVLMGLCLAWAATAPWLALKIAASVGAGLLMVRGFIFYHDYLHGSILRDSFIAKCIIYTMGVLTLTPPRSWRSSHDFHHAHVGQLEHSHVGSFAVLTVSQWQQAGFGRRLYLRFSRSPLILGLAYVFVFFWAITLQPLLRNPREHWDSAVTLLAHAAWITALALLGGWQAVILVGFLPMMLAGALGAYLFWVQHNFEGIKVLQGEEWSRSEAALESSSYLHLGPVMRYLTGNIGFHHVHHANHRIPFYRLPEAMAAVPALTPRHRCTLSPRQIWTSLRLHLWSEAEKRLVGWREARHLPA